MRDLLVIFDSVRYDRFLEAETPILDRLGEVVMGWTHGRWTRPSVVSIFSGYLPYSERYGRGPYNPSYSMLGKDMFGREVSTWFFNSNPWVHNLRPTAYAEKYYEQKPVESAEAIVKDAKAIMETEKEFFVAILFIETHLPCSYRKWPSSMPKEIEEKINLIGKYNEGEDNEAPTVAADRSRKAISYLDRQVESLLSLADRIIFTSDHGDLHGECHKIGHGSAFPFHPALFQVPLIVRGF